MSWVKTAFLAVWRFLGSPSTIAQWTSVLAIAKTAIQTAFQVVKTKLQSKSVKEKLEEHKSAQDKEIQTGDTSESNDQWNSTGRPD